MTRRSRTKVISDILTEALDGANKTRIMYRANLNFLRFNAYLSELLEGGLLKEENHEHGRVVYKVTQNGRDLLMTLRKAEEFISV
jgi:predicted transcriptional regulator